MNLKKRKIFIGTKPRKQFELCTAIEVKGLEIFYSLPVLPSLYERKYNTNVRIIGPCYM